MAEFAGLPKLQKHDAVIEMLTKLERRLGRSAFQIVDHWESDLDAVGVAHPSNRAVLAYIATYGPDEFYVELEVAPPPGSELPYSVAGDFRSLTFDELAQIVAGHLSSGGLGAPSQTPVRP